jgi:hypothetical protein
LEFREDGDAIVDVGPEKKSIAHTAKLPKSGVEWFPEYLG